MNVAQATSNHINDASVFPLERLTEIPDLFRFVAKQLKVSDVVSLKLAFKKSYQILDYSFLRKMYCLEKIGLEFSKLGSPEIKYVFRIFFLLCDYDPDLSYQLGKKYSDTPLRQQALIAVGQNLSIGNSLKALTIYKQVFQEIFSQFEVENAPLEQFLKQTKFQAFIFQLALIAHSVKFIDRESSEELIGKVVSLEKKIAPLEGGYKLEESERFWGLIKSFDHFSEKDLKKIGKKFTKIQQRKIEWLLFKTGKISGNAKMFFNHPYYPFKNRVYYQINRSPKDYIHADLSEIEQGINSIQKYIKALMKILIAIKTNGTTSERSNEVINLALEKVKSCRNSHPVKSRALIGKAFFKIGKTEDVNQLWKEAEKGLGTSLENKFFKNELSKLADKIKVIDLEKSNQLYEKVLFEIFSKKSEYSSRILLKSFDHADPSFWEPYRISKKFDSDFQLLFFLKILHLCRDKEVENVVRIKMKEVIDNMSSIQRGNR